MKGPKMCRDCGDELSPDDAGAWFAAGFYRCDDCLDAWERARFESEIAELRRVNADLRAAVDRFMEAQRVALDELEEIAA